MRVRKAFTLVELMIVAGIIGILLGIAVPSWMHARENHRRHACWQNLRQIENAKQYFAMENRLTDGAAVAKSDLEGNYLKGTFPICGAGGTYTINAIGTLASCSEHGTGP